MSDFGDVLRRYGPAYIERFAENMLPSHRRAIQDLIACRTPQLGGRLFGCRQCGHRRYVYHSCCNRHCPKCYYMATQQWLSERHKELLPVTYFHVVFTLPHELHRLVRSHQKTLYGVLMKAAAESLIQLAKDPKYLGAKPGVLSVLHTWTRTLAYHPHVHCLVTGGGLTEDGKHWVDARPNFFVPVRALSQLFRGRFTALLRKALPQTPIPQAVFEKKWVVYCKPSAQGPQKLLEYLGRYVHRIALSNARIVKLADDKVTFSYTESNSHKRRQMTLPVFEFIRRFLQHVLPQGFHKVRYYGLLSPSKRSLFQYAQTLLAERVLQAPRLIEDRPDNTNDPQVSQVSHNCPNCQTGILVLVQWLPKMKPANALKPP